MTTTFEPVSLRAWPGRLTAWLGGAEHAGSPERCPVRLIGHVNPGDAGFSIGEARDALGTLIKLAPEFPKLEKAEKEPPLQKWRQLWAKVAVRAGYQHPGIDPSAYRLLCDLRRRGRRVELIFDTSELLSGAGHWLVRFFGERVDVVSTVISQREVHRWRDGWGGKPVANFGSLEHRAQYLAASRFIERLPHRHPIWRTLDVLDEGALLLADGSNAGGKSANADTLLFRAAKRYILDQVPSLRRFFVTGDVAVARAAAHVLPAGTTISTWISALPESGSVLAPLHWWGGNDHGAGVLCDLAGFAVETLSVCAELEVRRADNAKMIVRLFQPGINESPSTWRNPIVWIAVDDPAPPSAAPSPRARATGLPPLPETASAADCSATADESPDEEPSVSAALTIPPLPVAQRATPPPVAWPLHFELAARAARRDTGARLTPRTVLDGIADVMVSARDRRPVQVSAFDALGRQGRELRRLLSEDLELLTPEGAPTNHARALPRIFAEGDLDALSSLLSSLEPFRRAVEAVRGRRKKRPSGPQPRDRKLETFTSLARALGVLVATEHAEVVYGGANPSRDELVNWLQSVLEEQARREPLGDVPVLDVARRALDEIELSPARLERALNVLLQDEPRLVPKKGASDSRSYVETVARLTKDGVQWAEVSADGICGLRALAWRGR